MVPTDKIDLTRLHPIRSGESTISNTHIANTYQIFFAHGKLVLVKPNHDFPHNHEFSVRHSLASFVWNKGRSKLKNNKGCKPTF